VVPIDTLLGPDYAVWAPGYVVRRPPDAQYPNLPGEIAYLVQYPTNAGNLTTAGLDVNVQWSGSETRIGALSVTLNGTYVLDYTVGGYQSVDVPSGVGTRGVNGAISRYRQYAQFNWTYGVWAATLANNFQSGYNELCNDNDASGCTMRRVGSYSVW